jgi:type VI protein secretion system component VasK
MDRDEETGLQRLMTIQYRAASITALRQAPLVVVQIVEDVLAQTSATHADLMTNPLTRAWQAEVLPLCQQTVDGRYPFAQGNDADLSAVTRLLAPGGAFDRYFRTRAEPYLDMNASPWRWKPEARFAGLEPDSAVFFQQARAISEGLFTPDGTIGANMTLAALAERGKTFISIGGQGGPVEASTDSLRLAWPGAAADSGVEVSFQTPDGSAQLTERGPWGLLRLLDPIRLRERDEGRRFLVDIRSGGARIFLEIGFERPDNFLSRRNLLKGFSCPQVL